MRIDNTIEGLKLVVGYMDKHPEVKSWYFNIHSSSISNGDITVEADILCLVDLLKVMMTSLRRVSIEGSIPKESDFDQKIIYGLTFYHNNIVA